MVFLSELIHFQSTSMGGGSKTFLWSEKAAEKVKNILVLVH